MTKTNLQIDVPSPQVCSWLQRNHQTTNLLRFWNTSRCICFPVVVLGNWVRSLVSKTSWWPLPSWIPHPSLCTTSLQKTTSPSPRQLQKHDPPAFSLRVLPPHSVVSSGSMYCTTGTGTCLTSSFTSTSGTSTMTSS